MSDVFKDIYEINRLICRYNSTVDRGDFEGWASCFADGGVFDGAYQAFTIPQDVEKFRQMATGIMHAAPNIRHYVTNVQVDVDGDTAHAESFLLLLSTPLAREDGTVPNSRIVQAGIYHDDLVRVDGAWKFTLRRVEIDGAPVETKPTWTADA